AEAMTRGLHETTRNTGNLVQENLARTLNAGRAMMEAKTLNEMVDAHAEFMRECFDCMMAGTGKISEISVRTTKDALEPVAQHANETINKITRKSRENREFGEPESEEARAA